MKPRSRKHRFTVVNLVAKIVIQTLKDFFKKEKLLKPLDTSVIVLSVCREKKYFKEFIIRNPQEIGKINLLCKPLRLF